MSSIILKGNSSGAGSSTLQSANTGSAVTQTLPSVTATTLGYINAPLDSKTDSYTLVDGDQGKVIYLASGSSKTFTIPANGSVAFEIGTVITFVNVSASALTIAITTDTLYQAGTGSTGSRTLAQYGIATAVKMTSTTWLISGNGLT